MDVSTVDALSERLDRLERENLWLKRIGGGAIAVLLAMVGFGTNAFRAPKQISAEKFVMTDTNGRARATLALGRDGGPALTLLDPHGNDQVSLSASNDGSSNLQYFHNRSLRASLSNITGIGASVNLLNRSPRSRAEMFMTEDGSSGVSFNRERRGVGMNVQLDGTSKVSLTDRDGEERAGMIVTPNGSLTNLSKPGQSKSNYSEALNVPPTPTASPKIQRISTEVQEEATPGPAGGTLGRRAFGAP